MIVMDPDDVIRAENIPESVGEQPVNLFVLIPERPLVDRVRRKIMKQRPDRRVTKTQVELFHLVFGQEDGIRPEFGQRLARDLIAQGVIDAAARPPDPEMLARQRRVVLTTFLKRSETRHQTAGARMKNNAAVLDGGIEQRPVP